MHAILFQLGALPITMCRLIISKASRTFLNSVIPFNEALKCHIAIGYTLVFMLFLTIVVFLMFFGVNCSDGDTSFCAKFTSEIMITGYVIFGLFLTVAGAQAQSQRAAAPPLSHLAVPCLGRAKPRRRIGRRRSPVLPLGPAVPLLRCGRGLVRRVRHSGRPVGQR